MPGRNLLLSDNFDKINDLDTPSANELLWTTTMSFCNVYFLTYKMFVGVGIPMKNIVYSNNEIEAILTPDNSEESETSTEYLRFREASQIIENIVFEVKKFENITDNDNNMDTGLTLWHSIQDAMVEFMNHISSLIEEVRQNVDSLEIQQEKENSVDPIAMRNLYINIFEQTITAVSKSTALYKESFNFLVKYDLKIKVNNNQVSKIQYICNL